MTVYMCEGSFEGILCGVYDAWMSKKGHEHVRLELEGYGDMELFCTYESVIYRFLVGAFRYGKPILSMLHLPSVFGLFELCRFVEHENHQLTGFLRFSRTEQGVLISRIGPKSDVLPLLAVHFSDRLPSAHWRIYDEKRKYAVIHPADKAWYILREDEERWLENLEWKTDEEEYAALWKLFHQNIAIPERINRRCQMNHLPVRYRPYMTEFS